MKKMDRFMELEGLRGLAAIVVVVYHAILMFYPGIAYGHDPNLAPVQNMRFEDNLYGHPLNVFLSGGFAVAIFFVLSGFVLSIGFFQTNKESIIQRLASKRYLRLMLPALASTILAFLLIVGGFAVNMHGTVDIAHSGSLAAQWTFVPNIYEAIKHGAVSIFLQSGTAYNPVLWTMFFEFIGSFIVFITLLVFGKSNYRWLAYGALVFATYNTWFLAVILGMVLADVYNTQLISKLADKAAWLWGVLALGLLIGGHPYMSSAGTFYEWLHISSLTDEQNAIVYMTLGAVCVVTVVLYLAPLSKLLARPNISILGRYTYSLYLTHTFVLYTLCTTMFVLFSQYFGINKSALFSVIATLPAIIAVAWLFEKYVDAPSVRFANYMSDITLGRRELKINIKDRLNAVSLVILNIAVKCKKTLISRLQYNAKENEAE